MTKRIEKVSRSRNATSRDRHRFEHWHVDNQIYFITARCHDQFPAFASEVAKKVFWDRFDYYTAEFGFVPWVTSLLDNHYHTLDDAATAWLDGETGERLVAESAASVLARRKGARIFRQLHSR